MIQVPVCIVGCGPIGLSGALLLSKLGIPTLIIEKRGELHTHPRSRFVDANTMELMRLFGIEKEVENTGLGPDWTAFNRWSESLTGREFAAIPSPTFHTVPNTTSPCLPVMTCQDYVEVELLAHTKKQDDIDCRFNTEARNIRQDERGVFLTIYNSETDTSEEVEAQYLIGSDGPHSPTRYAIGSELEAEPMGLWSQDVIFDADLTQYVGNDKGGLLYTLTPDGVSVFQPLNGARRWRIQLFKPQEEPYNNDEIIHRIQSSIGSTEPDIALQSVGQWRPTPGCASSFGKGRIFLAGDAAHVSTPTGGMGNNIGFFGIRNLTWKLAHVIQNLASPDILDTYEEEMRPTALKRIAHGVDTAQNMGILIRACYAGEDLAEGKHATRMYADYDGVILGHEMTSSLIAPETEDPPVVKNEVSDFIPCVRNGRRAPHIWLDDDRQVSILDWFGTSYVLIAGKHVNADDWQKAAHSAKTPIEFRQMSASDPSEIYSENGLVLVRPDGIIADHWDATEPPERLAALVSVV